MSIIWLTSQYQGIKKRLEELRAMEQTSRIKEQIQEMEELKKKVVSVLHAKVKRLNKFE